ncbi:hypothetical protein niasHS_001986 [Heterodera schachtii]|uniref:Trehalase n=1 Tax=Heterodera schachtii TaxID=97005 RepID=A0ABD2K5I0_HETSC
MAKIVDDLVDLLQKKCRRRKCRAASVGAANVLAASVCAASVALTGRRNCLRRKCQRRKCQRRKCRPIGKTKELDFWRKRRAVTVNRNGKDMTFYQYRAESNAPRPESFCQDVDTVRHIPEMAEKKRIWKEVASAAESGWDFSCDKEKANNYHKEFQAFREDVHELFYEEGGWFDFNLNNQTRNKRFYGSIVVPLFTRCYRTADVEETEKLLTKLEHFNNTNRILSHKFGVATSAIASGSSGTSPIFGR